MKNETGMSFNQQFDSEFFSAEGLNIHSIININNIPDALLNTLQSSGINTHKYNQLILIGHLGRSLWHRVKDKLTKSLNPIDDLSVMTVQKYFTNYYSGNSFEIIYPANIVIGLQQLGVNAGWHHDSPFKVGINEKWGSWFAYRAVILADTEFTETQPLDLSSPCVSCADQKCITDCPANALNNGEFEFNTCISYRKQAGSLCRNRCLARLACPVGSKYRYSDDQVNYHYSASLKTIEELY